MRPIMLALLLVLAACSSQQVTQTTPTASNPSGVSPNDPVLPTALPDAQFAGFADAVNNFVIQSIHLALPTSSNPLVRSYATRAINDYTNFAKPTLSRNVQAAGVTYAPQQTAQSLADQSMQRLNAASGAEFDRQF